MQIANQQESTIIKCTRQSVYKDCKLRLKDCKFTVINNIEMLFYRVNIY